MELSNQLRREVFLLLKAQVPNEVKAALPSDYLARLEHAVFEFSQGHWFRYQNKYLQLMHTLTYEPQKLMDHPPQKLVHLQNAANQPLQTNDDLLFQNLVKTSHQHMEQVSQTLEHTLDLPAITTNPAVITCRKCRSTEITYDQKMLRSGDEPMSTIYSCQSCGNRWKV